MNSDIESPVTRAKSRYGLLSTHCDIAHMCAGFCRDATILPSTRSWPRDSVRIRPHKVKVQFGEPIFPAQSDAADPYQADTDSLRKSVASIIRD